MLLARRLVASKTPSQVSSKTVLGQIQRASSLGGSHSGMMRRMTAWSTYGGASRIGQTVTTISSSAPVKVWEEQEALRQTRNIVTTPSGAFSNDHAFAYGKYGASIYTPLPALNHKPEDGLWTLASLRALVSQVSFKSHEFRILPRGDAFLLQVRFEAPCVSKMHSHKRAPDVTVNGHPPHDMGADELQSGRKWDISKHMTPSEVISTAFLAVLQAEEHEVRENFRYRGQNIYGPHFNVDELAELLELNRVTLDSRPDHVKH
jgi:hypothetical protein